MPDGSNTPSRRSIVVSEFTNSVLDPDAPMLGPVENGGTIIANTAPGCWGPMITPALRGGHEVTRPVFVDGAEVGDGPDTGVSAVPSATDRGAMRRRALNRRGGE